VRTINGKPIADGTIQNASVGKRSHSGSFGPLST